VVGLVLLDLVRRGLLREVVWLVVGTVVMAITVLTLKDYFAVARPADALITLDDYAFPSGHATSATFLAMLLGWYGYKILALPKLWLFFGLVTICLLVGWSRLYLQVHTVDQVLAGFVLGVIIGSALWWQLQNKWWQKTSK